MRQQRITRPRWPRCPRSPTGLRRHSFGSRCPRKTTRVALPKQYPLTQMTERKSARVLCTSLPTLHLVAVEMDGPLWMLCPRNWVWVKIKPTFMDRRFWSMFPFTRIPFWVHIFDPQPNARTAQRCIPRVPCQGKQKFDFAETEKRSSEFIKQDLSLCSFFFLNK